MIKWEEKMDIISDYRQGLSLRQLTRKYGRSRNTIRKIIRGEHKGVITRSRKSKLDPFKEHVQRRWQELGMPAKLVFEEIRGMGYDGSYDLVQEFIKTLRREDGRKHKLTVRFETAPGLQAQVDWKEFAPVTLADGAALKLSIFTMILGFSRMSYSCFTTSTDMETLQRCHMQAFAFFGGVPKEILYDNMSTVRDINTGRKNEKFLQFACHYGFKVKLCQVRRPRTKGKVERFIGYVQTSFLPGREFTGLDDANRQLLAWLSTVAGRRVHAATGKIPAEELPKDLAAMTPVGDIGPWLLPTRKELRRANFEGYARYQNSYYSVGKTGAGKTVEIEDANGSVRISLPDGTFIIEHQRADKSGSTLTSKQHLQEMWKLTMQACSPASSKSRGFTFRQDEGEVQTRRLASYEELC